MKKIIEKLFRGSKQCVILSEAQTHPNLPLKREGTKSLSPLPLGEGRILNELASCKNSGEGGTKESRHAEFISASQITPSSDTSCHLLPPMGRRQFCFGFTLAEVLITLGIIGVVAALTLPSLIQKYQKQVWVNQLKKAVSTIEQGFQKMMADDGVDTISNTNLGSLGAYEGYINLTAHNEILKKYFNIIKVYDIGEEYLDDSRLGIYEKNGTRQVYSYLDKNLHNNGEVIDSDQIKIYFADGTLIGLFLTPGNDPDCGNLGIDVNGDSKGPNQFGRDTFGFQIHCSGRLIPLYKDYWATRNLCGNDKNNSNIENSNGFGCSTRILADGWKMNY